VDDPQHQRRSPCCLKATAILVLQILQPLDDGNVCSAEATTALMKNATHPSHMPSRETRLR
jgi:hypothetical protein